MSVPLREQIIQAIEQLSEEDQRQILNMIRDWSERPEKTSDFVDFVAEEADPTVSLAQVRRELGTIQGNLSELISNDREERA
ncbi:MAG: hypothetical protein ABEL51_06485 [Salinibacter sp.]